AVAGAASGEVAADVVPPGPNTVGSAAQVQVRVSRETTEALLTRVPAAYHTEVTASLLAGVVTALGETTGAWRWRIELEGHGREPDAIGAALEVSRTVGWFTTQYPILLTGTPHDAPAARVRAGHAQLQTIPRRGVGYGVLRYLADVPLPAAPAAIAFNYLGQ